MNAQNLAYKTSNNIVHTRIISSLIDCVILGIIILLAESTGFIKGVFLYIFPLVFAFVYYSAFEMLFGWTVGKYLLRLRVINNKCQKPSLKQTIIRALFWMIEINPAAFIFWLASYFIARCSKYKQRLGDKAAGTFVVNNKELKEFIENPMENTMHTDEFAAYHQTMKVKMIQSQNGSYIYDNKGVYIEDDDRKLKVVGIEGMSLEQVMNEVNRGGTFVYFFRCVSAILLTQKTPTNIYFIKSGEKPSQYHLKHTIFSMLFGWWGFPWGIIWTISCIGTNFSGGVDVTQEVISALRCGYKIKASEDSARSMQALFRSDVEDLKNKFLDMSDYEFKTKYWNNLSNFNTDVAELIKTENERRISNNPNYENYCPQEIDDISFHTYRNNTYRKSSKSKSKTVLIVIGALVFIGIFISIFTNSDDYNTLAHKNFDFKNYSEAVQYVDKYLSNHPNDETALLFKADCLYELNKYDEALSVCDKVLKLNSKSWDAYFYKGKCNYALFKSNEALKNLDKAISLDPKKSEAYVEKADALNDLKDYENAMKAIEIALSIKPNDAIAMQTKGETFMYMKKYPESINIFEKAIKIAPDQIQLYVDKMAALYTNKDYSACIKFCREVNDKFPHDENSLLYTGYCYSIKENHNEAIKSFEKAASINPKADDIMYSIASEYFIMQDYNKAREYTDKALDLNSENKAAIKLRQEIVEAQKPESIRIADFIRDNYLYIDKQKDAESLLDSFSKKANVDINDIGALVNSIKLKDDRFTFLISGKDYDDMMNFEANNHIEVKTIDKNLKYIKISMFTQGIAYEFKDAIEQIKDSEQQTLIIDLRDNPGGLAYPTNNMLDALLPECVTSYRIYRDGKIDASNSDSNQYKFKGIYIFVNQNSASSSELLSLGLKKYLNNVTIIGTPTVGKGVGQLTFENKNKKYILFLVNHYWNVKEKNIMGENIKPDIYVKDNSDTEYFKYVRP
ncbi:MAG TPA: S41 family peptidase [Clostridia bacterium]